MTVGTIQSPQASSEVCTWTLVEVVRWLDTKRARNGHDSLTFLKVTLDKFPRERQKVLKTVHQHCMG